MRKSIAISLTLLALAACSANDNTGVPVATGGSNGQIGNPAGGAQSSGGAIAKGGAAIGGAVLGGAPNSGGTIAGGQASSTTTATSGGSTSSGGALNSGGTPSGGSGPASGGATAGGNVAASGKPSGGSGTSLGTGGRTNSGGSGNPAGGTFAGGAGGAPGGTTNGAGTPEPFVPGNAPAAAKYFKKGINLGNRLEAPNEGDWGGKILASDLPFIARRGFDHVRIPIRFSGHALTTAPYTIEAAFFSRVDAVLDQAAQAKLAVVIDMHAYDELAANPSGQRERFLALWSQISARYRERPENVAFELLNEPYSLLDTTWNDLASAAIQVVRTSNPRRLLVVDSVYWADPSRLSQLTLPNDANIMASIHLYEPKLFSFQGKSWMGAAFMTTGIVFPGPPASPVTPVAEATAASWAKSWFDAYNSQPAATNPSGPATIAAQLAFLTNYRSSSGRTVYNGEWGPQDGGDLASRARLVTLVRQECEKAGIGWAIWEDPNNMKLFDSAANTWVTAIADALLPP